MDGFFHSHSLGDVMPAEMPRPHPDDDRPRLDNWGRPMFREVEPETNENTENDEDEDDALPNHPSQENRYPRWFRMDTRPVNNPVRHQNITHLTYTREETMQWFLMHGRTVQAPELNMAQIRNLDDARLMAVMERVTRWYRILEHFRARIRGHNSGLLGPRLEWSEDLDSYRNPDDLYRDNDDPAYDDPNMPDASADAEADGLHRPETDFAPEPDFDPIFGDDGHGHNADRAASRRHNYDHAPSLYPPSIMKFTLDDLLATMTPDDRIVFDYFWKHPELTSPMSVEAFQWMHLCPRISGHQCPHAGDHLFMCYIEHLIDLYARYEQVAINEFRTQPNPRQWTTSSREGVHSWQPFAMPSFVAGRIAPMEAQRASTDWYGLA
ncbi:hypothetical protein Sste5346_002033 [Sporothrix stenoceras]|uniref:Uncharacterized protein n=1 Tax=Sporothrix stenoceras TaxID=5173 RepID=A0ABR3ZLL6_9PEZI